MRKENPNPIHFFLHSITHSSLVNNFLSSSSCCRDDTFIHSFHLFARRIIIQPWHFPALQRDGLGKCLVCRSTPQCGFSPRCCTEHGYIGLLIVGNNATQLRLLCKGHPVATMTDIIIFSFTYKLFIFNLCVSSHKESAAQRACWWMTGNADAALKGSHPSKRA